MEKVVKASRPADAKTAALIGHLLWEIRSACLKAQAGMIVPDLAADITLSGGYFSPLPRPPSASPTTPSCAGSRRGAKGHSSVGVGAWRRVVPHEPLGPWCY
jgi:hypothetical protein